MSSITEEVAVKSESYRSILDSIGWNMVQDDADDMANVGSLTARQWLSQLNSNERFTLAVRRLYMKTAKVVATENPTEPVLQEQYEQAEEEYHGTLSAYMQLIRESWHLHEDEADEHMQSRVWDPGGSEQAVRVIES